MVPPLFCVLVGAAAVVVCSLWRARLTCTPCAPRSVGWKYSCCTDPAEWYLNGPSGFWTTAFVFSKIPELGDTAFLVVKKKPVIFLHWFHHV